MENESRRCEETQERGWARLHVHSESLRRATRGKSDEAGRDRENITTLFGK
jgi:hypothetical protein